jgi:tRNA (mo5U34)-methyltransferase
MAADAREAIAGLNWWHTIEVAPGVVTPWPWDLRPTAELMPWPASLSGVRCLDVGTMDGFWAFELERRGAGEVLAIDVGETDHARLKWRPAAIPRRPDLGQTFRVAADLLGSRAEYRDLSVYDLDPDDVGEFDVVVMGFVLQMLRDPLRGLEAVRSVCRGHLILLDTVSRPLSLVPCPIVRLDARRDGREFFVFNPRGMRKALELSGFHVEEMTRIFRDTYAPPTEPVSLATRLMHDLGIRGSSVAARARRQF